MSVFGDSVAALQASFGALFGRTVQYEGADVVARLHRAEHLEEAVNARGRVNRREMKCTVALADLPAGAPALNAEVTVDGDAWYVAEIEVETQARAVLILHRTEDLERAGDGYRRAS